MHVLLASLCAALLASAIGAVLWTVAEHLLHRFVFHGASAKRLGAGEHRQHHARVDYFAPWWQKALPTGPYGRWRRMNHFAHHFVDPRRAQGVTTRRDVAERDLPRLGRSFSAHRRVFRSRFMAWLSS